MPSDRPLTLVVTAINGDLAQATVKALRLSEHPMTLIGTDCAPITIGQAWVDQTAQLPRADDPAYFDALHQLLLRTRADVLIPSCEPEIMALARHLHADPHALPQPCRLLAHDARWLETFGDKLCCYQALAAAGVDVPLFCDGDDADAVRRLVDQARFPLIVKERRSSGSRSIRRVNTLDELQHALTTTRHPVVQQYLDDADGEFSVGVFRCPGQSAAIAFRRDLHPSIGLSWSADNLQPRPAVERYALDIASAADMRGSCNVQVRVSGDKVGLLEINPRFSSLVAARAAAGFNDAWWSLQLLLGDQPNLAARRIQPIRFQRFFHELIDMGEGFAAHPGMQPRPIARSSQGANP